jgi:hypothetical protein
VNVRFLHGKATPLSIDRLRAFADSIAAASSAVLAFSFARDHGAFGHVTPTRASTESC